MKGIILLIWLVLSPLAGMAQIYQYQLNGSYKLESSKNQSIDYTLKWSEENGRIKGVYSDNYFAKSAPVSGEGTDTGRTFVVSFPELKEGIKSVTILGSVVKDKATATALPIVIVSRDGLGNPLSTAKASGNFITTSYSPVAQLQEDNECTEGFGVLTGYCGTYAGLLAEEQDRRNKCNLLFSEAVRLELTTDGTILLHLGEINTVVTTPAHSIGRIPFNPQKNSVDIMSRVCAPLSGVNSVGNNCKVIHLKGNFETVRDIKRFKGTYSISEEGTNNVCRYSLSMDKEED